MLPAPTYNPYMAPAWTSRSYATQQPVDDLPMMGAGARYPPLHKDPTSSTDMLIAPPPHETCNSYYNMVESTRRPYERQPFYYMGNHSSIEQMKTYTSPSFYPTSNMRRFMRGRGGSSSDSGPSGPDPYGKPMFDVTQFAQH